LHFAHQPNSSSGKKGQGQFIYYKGITEFIKFITSYSNKWTDNRNLEALEMVITYLIMYAIICLNQGKLQRTTTAWESPHIM